MAIIAYTDGSCMDGDGAAGACLFNSSGLQLGSCVCRFKATTNNRMELMAAIMAMHWCGDRANIDLWIHTDSKYVCDNYNDYLEEWKINGWRKTHGQPVLNIELWKRLDFMAHVFSSVQFYWVEAHAHSDPNNLVDRMVFNAVTTKENPYGLGRFNHFSGGGHTCNISPDGAALEWKKQESTIYANAAYTTTGTDYFGYTEAAIYR